MGILADFADLLPHLITWERVASVSDDGTPTYDPAQSFTARVDYKRSSLVTTQGDLIGTRGSVIVGGTPIVRPGDRITLPDGSQPPILDAAVTDDEVGVPYVTIITLG
jgi:hypothetical protein